MEVYFLHLQLELRYQRRTVLSTVAFHETSQNYGYGSPFDLDTSALTDKLRSTLGITQPPVNKSAVLLVLVLWRYIPL